MHWLQALDINIFRFINGGLVNPFLDRVMPFASGNAFFAPILFLVCVWLLIRGGARGRLFLLMFVLSLAVSDGWVCNTLKHAVARPRPFATLDNVRVLLGRGSSFSMPSSHAANWFAATLVAFVYCRRSLWFMLPLALIVSFSRVYNGVHYPSDVAAGAVLGLGSAGAVLVLANAFWGWAGRKWFPLWWEHTPSLVAPPPSRDAKEEEEEEQIAVPSSRAARAQEPVRHASPEAHWLRLGYIVIAALFIAHLAYIASGVIELSEDESYQWLWSKHLALSYYSKPLLIAVTQFLGTHLWGDTVFGIRFFSPVIAAILSFIVLRFFARTVNARASFFLLLAINVTPLMA
ncbi:MAG TPA: phosphatase PAP2 family protein, partial [Verrucomicrobiae bacterium]|nr:phosphatase PAP2 family protein [Verrucomicrobiae bacterium]